MPSSSTMTRHGSPSAYIHNCEAFDVAYQLVYAGQSLCSEYELQLISVNVARLDESPDLTGHYIVDTSCILDDSSPSESFLSSSRQSIPLMGRQALLHDDNLGTVSSPLLRVFLEALVLHDAPMALPRRRVVYDLSAAALQHRHPFIQLFFRFPERAPPRPPNSYVGTMMINVNSFFTSATLSFPHLPHTY